MTTPETPRITGAIRTYDEMTYAIDGAREPLEAAADDCEEASARIQTGVRSLTEIIGSLSHAASESTTVNEAMDAAVDMLAEVSNAVGGVRALVAVLLDRFGDIGNDHDGQRGIIKEARDRLRAHGNLISLTGTASSAADTALVSAEIDAQTIKGSADQAHDLLSGVEPVLQRSAVGSLAMTNATAITVQAALLTEVSCVVSNETDGFRSAAQSIYSALGRLDKIYDDMVTEREKIDEVRVTLRNLMVVVNNLQFNKDTNPSVAAGQTPESQLAKTIEDIAVARTSLQIDAADANRRRLHQVKEVLGVVQLTKSEISQVTQNLQAYLASQT